MTFSKLINMPVLGTALLFSALATLAHADPATFHIKSGDPDVALNISHKIANSCYEGPAKTSDKENVVWRAPKKDKATFHVGRNSSVSGCVGEICVEFSPAEDGQQYQCFVIHGGGAVAPNPAHTPPLHRNMTYNNGTWDAVTQTYTTAKLPQKIRDIAAADTIYTIGSWKRVCSPTGKCSMSSLSKVSISDTLAKSMTDELETTIASTISNTVSVGVETSTPVSKTSVSDSLTASITASLKKAVSHTKSRTQGTDIGREETLNCEYDLRAGEFGYVYQTSVKIGGETMTHYSCDFACGSEEPTFEPGSMAHLNSCRG